MHLADHDRGLADRGGDPLDHPCDATAPEAADAGAAVGSGAASRARATSTAPEGRRRRRSRGVCAGQSHPCDATAPEAAGAARRSRGLAAGQSHPCDAAAPEAGRGRTPAWGLARACRIRATQPRQRPAGPRRRHGSGVPRRVIPPAGPGPTLTVAEPRTREPVDDTTSSSGPPAPTGADDLDDGITVAGSARVLGRLWAGPRTYLAQGAIIRSLDGVELGARQRRARGLRRHRHHRRTRSASDARRCSATGAWSSARRSATSARSATRRSCCRARRSATGCFLGERTLVPAGQRIPPGSVAVGQPARVIRAADEADQQSPARPAGRGPAPARRAAGRPHREDREHGPALRLPGHRADRRRRRGAVRLGRDHRRRRRSGRTRSSAPASRSSATRTARSASATTCRSSRTPCSTCCPTTTSSSTTT